MITIVSPTLQDLISREECQCSELLDLFVKVTGIDGSSSASECVQIIERIEKRRVIAVTHRSDFNLTLDGDSIFDADIVRMFGSVLTKLTSSPEIKKRLTGPMGHVITLESRDDTHLTILIASVNKDQYRIVLDMHRFEICTNIQLLNWLQSNK